MQVYIHMHAYIVDQFASLMKTFGVFSTRPSYYSNQAIEGVFVASTIDLNSLKLTQISIRQHVPAHSVSLEALEVNDITAFALVLVAHQAFVLPC